MDESQFPTGPPLSESSVFEATPTIETVDLGPAPKPRRKRTRTIVAGVAAVALVGGGVFAVTAITGANSGGAASPEEAVQQLFDAISDEDLVGVMDTMLPDERDTFKQPVSDAVKELKRLKVLDSKFELDKVPGVEVEFKDLSLESTEVADGFVAVTVKDARVSASAQLQQLPLGTFVRDILDDHAPDALSENPTPVSNESIYADDVSDPIDIVAVRDGSKWYVSLWYTVAEAARKAAGIEDAPDFGHGLTAVGSSSPDDAVKAMAQAAVRLDIQRVFELLPPGEARALHDYAPLFLEDLKDSLADAKQTVKIRLTHLDTEVQDKKDDTARVHIGGIGAKFSWDNDSGSGEGTFDWTGSKVKVDVTTNSETIKVSVEQSGDCFTFRFETTVEDDFDDESGTVSGKTCRKGDCVTYETNQDGEKSSGKICAGDKNSGDDAADMFGGIGIPTECSGLMQSKFDGYPGLRVTTVEENGQWYVSPIRSIANMGIDGLKALDTNFMTEARNCIEAFVAGIGDDFSSDFVPLDPDGDFPADDFFTDDSFPDDPFTDNSFTFGTSDFGSTFDTSDPAGSFFDDSSETTTATRS